LGLAGHDLIANVVGNERERVAPGSEAVALAREGVLVDVLAAVDERVSACLEGGFASLLNEFAEHDALAGQKVVVSGASPITGIARGVDSEGRLLVESDGLLIPIVSGTVRAVRG
jgi:biotin-(acetyl-CoA carboxylase) ligase